MADRLHRLRRWFWLLRNPMRRVELLRDKGCCLDCGVKLTENERTYYDMNCERCEAMSPYAQPEPIPARADARGRRRQRMVPRPRHGSTRMTKHNSPHGVRACAPAQPSERSDG